MKRNSPGVYTLQLRISRYDTVRILTELSTQSIVTSSLLPDFLSFFRPFLSNEEREDGLSPLYPRTFSTRPENSLSLFLLFVVFLLFVSFRERESGSEGARREEQEERDQREGV